MKQKGIVTRVDANTITIRLDEPVKQDKCCGCAVAGACKTTCTMVEVPRPKDLELKAGEEIILSRTYIRGNFWLIAVPIVMVLLGIAFSTFKPQYENETASFTLLSLFLYYLVFIYVKRTVNAKSKYKIRKIE